MVYRKLNAIFAALVFIGGGNGLKLDKEILILVQRKLDVRRKSDLTFLSTFGQKTSRRGIRL
ncbi:MAG: hypothetical protein II716_05995 [Treponema sp.]|nr:hypothetical protein [Treponema sp.]